MPPTHTRLLFIAIATVAVALLGFGILALANL